MADDNHAMETDLFGFDPLHHERQRRRIHALPLGRGAAPFRGWPLILLGDRRSGARAQQNRGYEDQAERKGYACFHAEYLLSSYYNPHAAF